MYLYGVCETVDYPHKELKNFDGGTLHANTEFQGMPPIKI